MASAPRRTVDDLLKEACARIDRLTPAAAWAELDAGASLVDIRAGDDRRREGIVPGSIHIPRTVLEWRVDPASRWRNPYLPGPDGRLILLCDHGYSSALAAATLAELGVARVADVVGGFEAWRAAGLPVRECPAVPPNGLRGSGPPD